MSLTSNMSSLTMDIENSARKRNEYIGFIKKHTADIMNNIKDQRTCNSKASQEQRKNYEEQRTCNGKASQEQRIKQFSERETDVRELISGFKNTRINMSNDVRQKLSLFKNELNSSVGSMLSSLRQDINGAKVAWNEKKK